VDPRDERRIGIAVEEINDTRPGGGRFDGRACEGGSDKAHDEIGAEDPGGLPPHGVQPLGDLGEGIAVDGHHPEPARVGDRGS